MPTRTIYTYGLDGNSGDLKLQGTQTFYISSDTGTITGNKKITGGRIEFSRVRTYITTAEYRLEVYLDGVQIATTIDQDETLSSTSALTCTLSADNISSEALTNDGSSSLMFKIIKPSAGHTSPGSSSNVINFRENCTATLYIEYEDQPTAPGAPTDLSLSKNSVGPSESVTLSWKAPSNTGEQNSIKGYKIYRSTSSSGTFSPISSNTTDTTSLTFSVTAPSTNGSKYYYKVQSIGTASGYTSGGTSSASGALTCNYSVPGAPTDFKINGLSKNIFVTKNDTLKIEWSEATTAGTNNSIQGYTIQRSTSESSGFTDLKTSATSPYSTTPNSSGSSYYYRMYTQGKYGTSSMTGTLKVTSISAPSKPTINASSYSTIAKSNITLSWTAPSAITGATYTYKVAYTYNGVQTVLENNYTQTSYTFDISKISENGTFTLNVATIAKSTNGGSLTSSYANTSTITRAPSFKIPETFWLHCYDPDNTDSNGKTGLQLYGHNKVYLQWAALSETGNSFKYTLKYRKTNDSTWTTVVDKVTTTSATISLANREGGDSFKFKVDIIDDYGTEQSTEYPSTFTKIKIPILENLSIKNVKYPNGNFSYSWDFPDHFGGDLKCEGYLYYEDKYVTLFGETYNIGDTQKNVTKSFNYDLKTSSTYSIIKGNLYNSLYAEVITNKNCYPQGKIKIKISSINFPNCYKEEWKNFTYDYVTSIEVGTLSFTKINNRNYYNPEDKIKISFTPATFKDAAGGNTGATISYKLEGNGGSWTEFTKESDDKFSYEDIAPRASEDLPITYTLTAFAQYADSNKTSISKSTNGNVNIARWNENDSVYLSSVKKEGSKVFGNLIIDGKLCSSINYGNIETVTYSLFNTDTGGLILSNKLSPLSYSSNPVSKSFEFTYTKEDNLSIYAIVTFTNTSEKVIEKITTAYLLRADGVPLAIRKGRIGINVSSEDFIFDINNDINNSALFVTAQSDIAPVMEISASSGGTNKDLLVYYKGANEVGRVSSRKDDAISISGLSQVINNIAISSSSGWTNSKYKIINSYITPTTIQEVLPSSNCTANELKAFQKANFIGGDQGDGWCEIICFGTKPTINIPITLIIRGG